MPAGEKAALGARRAGMQPQGEAGCGLVAYGEKNQVII